MHLEILHSFGAMNFYALLKKNCVLMPGFFELHARDNFLGHSEKQ